MCSTSHPLVSFASEMLIDFILRDFESAEDLTSMSSL